MKIEKINPNGGEVYIYPTWGEMIADTMRSIPPEIKDWELSSQEIMSDESPGKYWHGTKTFPEAVELANNGFLEAVPDIENLSGHIIETITSTIEKAVYFNSTEGAEIDIGAYSRGEPEAFIDKTITHAEGQGNRIIHLLFNCTSSAGVSQKEYRRKGSAIVALVSLLELSGFRVKITTVNSSSSGGISQDIFVTLKEADQPLNIGRLAFAICNIAYHRRLMFRIREQSPNRERFGIHKWGGGYGLPSVPKDEKGNQIKGDIDIPSYLSTMSETELIKWIQDQLKSCGVTLKGVEK